MHMLRNAPLSFVDRILSVFFLKLYSLCDVCFASVKNKMFKKKEA